MPKRAARLVRRAGPEDAIGRTTATGGRDWPGERDRRARLRPGDVIGWTTAMRGCDWWSGRLRLETRGGSLLARVWFKENA
eukprot:71480-Prorocentrum_minimum.AAC.2